MNIENLIWSVNSITILRLVHYESLLQNMTDIIINCDDRSSLQNASGFLLQNATVLLQNATDITTCDDLITKCDSYYKMRRLLKIGPVHWINSLESKYKSNGSMEKDIAYSFLLILMRVTVISQIHFVKVRSSRTRTPTIIVSWELSEIVTYLQNSCFQNLSGWLLMN